jgi:hypothetical protein
MFFKRLLLSVVLSAIVLSWQLGVVTSQTVDKNHLSTKRPAPPPRIPPNKVKPGGGLDFGQQACSSEAESLIALIPIENPVLTTQSYPSFLFYVPDHSSAISYGEFSLFSTDEKTRVYSTNIAFESTPGIVKINLPPSPQYALKEDQTYHWYLKIYCKNKSDSSTFLDVDGWIERVPLTPNRASQIRAASPDVWYDAIALAAKNLIATPQDFTAREHWLKLLQHINQEHLSNVGIKSVTPTSDQSE